VEIDQDRQIYTTQQENSKTNVAQVCKNTIFDRQAALFNGASMEAITQGFSKVRQLIAAVRTAR
jgi:hypothetical protein